MENDKVGCFLEHSVYTAAEAAAIATCMVSIVAYLASLSRYNL